MSVFVAKESPPPRTIMFSMTRSGVEIALDVRLCQMHGDNYVIAADLTSDDQINQALLRLTQELEGVAAEAKELLKKQRGG